ncbi:hypothetical protein AYO20_09090 [Fonsecaea nubica]|uniref:Uncharacterized protein n=1 Tax=Fonsecaea nubica TaxID=856822 RepID=A0A178CK89_9EURO|nr:hypothetical protein AYO20_09090 [Fonsecaea nubica]OAL29706.1 hypothetical protein AYO20_09090 [Fonsecaea nubica]
MTVHQAQGMTVDRAVLDLTERDFAVGLSYVAVLRVKTLCGILFKQPFDYERFKIRPSETVKARNADRERRSTQHRGAQNFQDFASNFIFLSIFLVKQNALQPTILSRIMGVRFIKYPADLHELWPQEMGQICTHSQGASLGCERSSRAFWVPILRLSGSVVVNPQDPNALIELQFHMLDEGLNHADKARMGHSSMSKRG